jgi:hypothetical protein
MKMHRVRLMLISAVLLIVLSMSACQTAAAKIQASDVRDVAWLQKSGNITVTFNAMMNFALAGDPTGNTYTYPTQMDVPAVPITWMGNIFNGKVTNSGQGYNLTDEVHGSVSSDGTWINEMTFSRKNLGQAGGSNFSVTLLNVPLVKADDNKTTTVASFLKKGTDIQKHVSKVEFNAGGASVSTTYVAIDWADTRGALRLELDFATGTGKRQMGGPSLSGGGM